jgi:hypothetical protein
MAGAVIPYYNTYWNVHHYLYIDSTGAEYLLDVNTDGVWSSKEGIYVWYDEATRRLYFRDGTFWVMDAVSGGMEEDAGARYPTIMQDTNGNQIRIRYQRGRYALLDNSSARVTEIEDVRAKWSPGLCFCTYLFHYSTQSDSRTLPHLLSIQNTISSAERYSFGYSPSVSLNSPFDSLSFRRGRDAAASESGRSAGHAHLCVRAASGGSHGRVAARDLP